MSIEEHAQNILAAREQCDDYNYVEYVKEEAQAILDAMKWIPVSERLPECGYIVLAVTQSGEIYKTWYESPFGWDNDRYEDSVTAWRELI